ncbi:hypothetical protein [Bdellovibrio sp. HCB-110]|uniref:hypothetical protein n=1 Tax=Bdellovibrio sp. HCB-110 TaxID=3391182 RepID=UPI0039B65E42
MILRLLLVSIISNSIGCATIRNLWGDPTKGEFITDAPPVINETTSLSRRPASKR